MAGLSCRTLVIGGGPAGSTAARALARGGVETILIEKDPARIKPCGGGMPSGALEELEVPQHVIKTKVEKAKLYSPGGEAVEMRLEGGFIAIVQRGEFDRTLREEAARAGAEVMEGRFVKFAETGSAYISEVLMDGTPRLIKSDYVIGADGISSRVRAAIGIKAPESVYTLSSRLEGLAADSCEFWLGSSHAPRFYSWVFPSVGGVTVGTGGHSIKGLGESLERFFRRRGLPTGGGPPARGYKLALWGRGVFNRSGVFFVGDAAGQVMPLSFEGIYYSMKAGLFAAEAIIRGRPSLYERLWKKRFRSRFLLAKGLWEYFFRDDASMERFVAMCLRPEVQELCMRIWLNKKEGGLTSVNRLLGRFVRR